MSGGNGVMCAPAAAGMCVCESPEDTSDHNDALSMVTEGGPYVYMPRCMHVCMPGFGSRAGHVDSGFAVATRTCQHSS